MTRRILGSGRDMALDVNDFVVLGRDPCPENDAVMERVAARHAVTEDLALLEVARPRRPPFVVGEVEPGCERCRGLAHHGSGQSHLEKFSAFDRHFGPPSNNSPQTALLSRRCYRGMA